ncbi:hypothetical protein E2562_005227, partial [Oryza meyeriana var. granulata]
EAYDFYNLYCWEVGSGIRYGKSAKYGGGEKTVQEFVCQCACPPQIAKVFQEEHGLHPYQPHRIKHLSGIKV